MILKIGIQNENDSDVVITTYDDITSMIENEPSENDSKKKEHLIHFLRPSLSGSPEEELAFNIDWDDKIIFAYLMNNKGKTFKVLKYDTRFEFNPKTDSITLHGDNQKGEKEI